MGRVRFVTTTSAGYSGITSKDKDTLYFISDERRIYKGEVPYSGGIFTTVAEFPETGEVNTLYVNSATGEVRYYNGTSYQTVVPATGKSITGKGDGSLATTAAVAAYVTSQIGNLNISTLNGRVDTLEGEMNTAQAALEDKATFLTRSTMDASLPQVGIATPLDYANAKELMANADTLYNDGSKCANINAMAEVINALCNQIDANAAAVTPISHGGTGATTKEDARKNLGIATVPDVSGTKLYDGGDDGYVWWSCRNSLVTIVWSVKQTTTKEWKAGSVGSKYAPALVVNRNLTVASWAPNGKTAAAWIYANGDLYLQSSVAQSDGRNVGSMIYFAHG